MDIPVKKIVRLLKADQPAAVRAAAAVVLGEVGAKDAEAAAELVARLTDPDPEVRIRAITACGKLKVAAALPTLLDRVTHGGPEAGPAAEAAATLGPKGVKGLQDLLHAVVPGVRKYIAAALTSADGGGHGDAVGAGVLMDRDPGVAAAAAAAIVANAPGMTPTRKAALADDVVALLGDKKKKPAVHAVAAAVRVLATLREPATAAVLWDYVLPPHAPEVRALALQTVGGWVPAVPPKDQAAKLFRCAADPAFQVAAPALMILSKLEPNEKSLADWLGLLAAADVAARRVGVDKIGGFDTPAVAAAMLPLFNDHDRGLRDAVQSRLAATKSGRKAILAALDAAENADIAWPLARAATGFTDDIAPAARAKLTAAAAAFVAAGDHRADALVFLARAADAAGLQDAFLAAAVGLRKKKKYDGALAYLKVVARDPAVGFAVRLELAVCGLKVSGKELAPNARDADPCLRSFATIFAQDAELLRKELAAAKFLDADDLFYVGFHFSEQLGRERAFGIELLQQVAKAAPKADAGKAAKNKLKSVGA